jgi:glycosyltransferase involved in cell wall biosynthesis
MNRRPRIAFVFTHQIQYFTNVLQALHDRGNADVRVFYAHRTEGFHDHGFGRAISWDNCKQTTFPSVLLPDSGQRPFRGFFSSFSFSLFAELSAFNPDIVHLNGYSTAIQWMAWLWALTHNKQLAARGDGDTLVQSQSRFAFFNHQLARLFTVRLATVFYQGIENKAFWISKGARPQSLTWIPCVSDNAVFRQSAFPSPAHREAFRAAAGALPVETIFVVSGKLESRKRPADALIAFQSLKHQPCRLWFLGSGPLEKDLIQQAQSLGIADRIHWWGFRNQSELPAVLQAADVLLHTSERDPWPYSILEGAMSGLALLLSDRTGSHPDLIQEAQAGLTFQCGNTDDLAVKMTQLLTDQAQRKNFADAALNCAAKHTEATFCDIIEGSAKKLTGQLVHPISLNSTH